LDDHRDWGWQIVNFVHYRNLRDEDARREYQRDWARKKRESDKSDDGAGSSIAVDIRRQASTESTSVDQRSTQYASKTIGQPDGFLEFWTAYPRKVKRLEAQKAWAKVDPDALLRSKILAALEVQKRSAEWARNGGQYIPHARTWLNGAQWEDQIGAPIACTDSQKMRAAL
jgi:hypothetical protein